MINFNGAAKRLADTDLPELGATIGVSEDEIHAFIDTESGRKGFDGQGRPIILFEPHVFYRELVKSNKPDELAAAAAQGLAYPHRGEKPYPADSYPHLIAAMAIDETAALKSASWGMMQVLGVNYSDLGFASVQAMVTAFCESERNQVKGGIDFLVANHLTQFLAAHQWAPLADGYNGHGYAKNGYDLKLKANFERWQKIPDTPWSPSPMAPRPVPAATSRPSAPISAPVQPATPNPSVTASKPFAWLAVMGAIFTRCLSLTGQLGDKNMNLSTIAAKLPHIGLFGVILTLIQPFLPAIQAMLPASITGNGNVVVTVIGMICLYVLHMSNHSKIASGALSAVVSAAPTVEAIIADPTLKALVDDAAKAAAYALAQDAAATAKA